MGIPAPSMVALAQRLAIVHHGGHRRLSLRTHSINRNPLASCTLIDPPEPEVATYSARGVCCPGRKGRGRGAGGRVEESFVPAIRRTITRGPNRHAASPCGVQPARNHCSAPHGTIAHLGPWIIGTTHRVLRRPCPPHEPRQHST